jgi:hypothetical protein
MVYLGRGEKRIPITWESLFWFGMLTAIGTVVGTWAYVQWIQPYQLPTTHRPNLPLSDFLETLATAICFAVFAAYFVASIFTVYALGYLILLRADVIGRAVCQFFADLI